MKQCTTKNNIVVFDTESDGFAYDCTKLHVMSWTTDGKEYHSTNDYDKMKLILGLADILVAHNAVKHDMVVFNRILGIPMDYRKYWDTMALSWFLSPERKKHGLASIGEEHGVPKPEVDDWQNLTYEEYAHRCEEDTKITWLEFQRQKKRLEEIYG